MTGRYSQRAFALPPGATEIAFIRHGASADAVPGEPFPLLDGHGDPPLSDLGHEQAAAVAERFANDSLAALFVTGLTRTVETAAPLAQKLGIESIEVPELREIRLGEYEGGGFRIGLIDGDATAWRAITEERWDVMPGAESPEAITARVEAGVAKIVERLGPDASGAAIVHGGIIGELCHLATRSRPFAFIHSDNCSISRMVVLPGGRWLLRSFNDVAHLG